MRKYFDMQARADNSADIYIYGFIGSSVWDQINPKQFIDDLKALGDVATLNVHINSEGGSVTAGNVIYNALKGHAATVNTYVEGLAASMASVVAMAGDNVYMADNALMMIHDPWTVADGNAAQLRKAADLLDKAKSTLVSSYANKTGLDAQTISDLMTAETWFTAEEAIAQGFADGSTSPVDLAACIRGLDLSGYKNAPPQLFLNQSAQPDTTKEVRQMSIKDKSKTPASEGSDPINANANAQSEPTGTDENANVEKLIAQAREEALKLEGKRRADIAEVFARFPDQFTDLQTACLMDSTIDKQKAQEMLLNKMGEHAEPLGHDIRVVKDVHEKRREGFEAAILARAHLIPSKPQERNEYRGLSLVEMARRSLEDRGISTRYMDRMEMVGAAFTHTSSDFPTILTNVANKALLKGWTEAPETFRDWTVKGTLPDFKQATRAGINTFSVLNEVGAGGEYTYGTVGEHGETIQLATYGKLFSITRQAIINDDLNAFNKIPMLMGRAALRTVGNLVYAVLTGNPTMADGTALFHTDHKNLGTTGAIATATVDELRKLMAIQTDGNATALGILPAYLLVPEALRGAASVVIESETEIATNQNNSRRPNSVRNIAAVISDARLDVASTTAFYLIANPAMFDTIEVAYLDGVESPTMETQTGWQVDGSEFKVRIDAGVKALDHRTFAKNAGA